MGINNAANKEIEIKFTLTDAKVAEFRQWLAKNAKYVGQQNQEEHYVNNPAKSFFFTAKQGYVDALKALRVRKTDQGDWVCYKYSNVDPVTGKILYKSECESKVENGDAFIEMFQNLGFTETILVKKRRTIYMTGDFEIVIDDVEKLGTFIEVELKRECADAQDGIAAINQFLKTMGVNEYNQFHRSYIHMFLNPGYNFSETVKLT